MQTQSLNEIKKTLLSMHPKDLTAICVRLARFKKENKELLNYLLNDADDENQYIRDVCAEADEMFGLLNTTGAYILTKQIRKILRRLNMHIRYSGQPATETEILMHFCKKLHTLNSVNNLPAAVQGIYQRQLDRIEKAMKRLHEDIRHDYRQELKTLHL